MLDDYVRFALDGIAHRKLRSYLTIIGVFIGITAVVVLISLGQGLEKYIDRQFEKVGGDRIIVSPGGGGFSSGPPGGSLVSAKLGEGDLEVVKRVRGVDKAMGVVMSVASVEYANKRIYASVIGVSTDPENKRFLEDADYASLREGSFFKKDDRYKVIVGPALGDRFDKEVGVGQKIVVEGVVFDVVGVLESQGNPMSDRRLVMPLKTAQELFNKTDSYAMLMVKAEKGSDPEDVAEKIKKRLRSYRNVKEGEEDFTVQTFQNMIESFKTVLNIVTVVLSGIAAISLIVGGIGIMTTMYTSVIERTRQIGIMKAIGARNESILMIFMFESGFMGLVGGVIGVILGVIASIVGELIVKYYIDEFTVYIGLDLVLGALAFSFIVGCVSGFLPSYQAAQMKPVDALRYR